MGCVAHAKPDATDGDVDGISNKGVVHCYTVARSSARRRLGSKAGRDALRGSSLRFRLRTPSEPAGSGLRRGPPPTAG